MFGAAGTSPRTKTQKVVWWAAFGIFFLFIFYVIGKNFLF